MTETTEHYFEGTVKWARVHSTDKFGKYSFNFYPKDAETRKAIKLTGVRNNVKEDDEGGLFYVFRRNGEDGPPMITDDAGTKIDALLGNGTEVIMKLSVEKFQSREHGDVTRSKVLGLVVKKLVEYKPEPKDTVEKPAPEKPAGMPF